MNTLRTGSPDRVDLDPDRMQMLRTRAAEWVHQGRTPSFVMLVARRGVVVLHEAFGPLHQLDGAPPLQTTSIFPIASNTKVVTSVALLTFVESGQVSLNAPVASYIEELAGTAWDDVPVRALLTHTSGMPSDAPREFVAKRLQRPIELGSLDATQHKRVELLLRALMEYEVPNPAGETMQYCDENFALVGEIIRRVSGQALEAVVQERIFSPLGMNDSSYRFAEHFHGRNVHRHPSNARALMDDPRYMDVPFAATGLNTTAFDYAKFLQMILNGGSYGDARILGPQTVRQMTRNQIPGIGTENEGWHAEASWGLGIRVLDDERWPWQDASLTRKGILTHGGGGGTDFWIDPENEIVGVYFAVCEDTSNRNAFENRSDFDLFQNMVCASIRP